MGKTILYVLGLVFCQSIMADVSKTNIQKIDYELKTYKDTLVQSDQDILALEMEVNSILAELENEKEGDFKQAEADINSLVAGEGIESTPDNNESISELAEQIDREIAEIIPETDTVQTSAAAIEKEEFTPKATKKRSRK